MSRKALPWETPFLSSNGLQDAPVQVVSHLPTVRKAVQTMKVKPTEEELQKWPGQLVIVEEVNELGEVKCKLVQATESIWLVPGALTERVKSEEELVQRTLVGIYATADQHLQKNTEVAVHVLCSATSHGDSLSCKSTSGEEVHELRGGALYHGQWRLKETEVDGQLQLKFILNKSDGLSDCKVMDVIPPTPTWHRSLAIRHIFCALNFDEDVMASTSEVEVFAAKVIAALHQELGTGLEVEVAINIFDALCCQLRRGDLADLGGLERLSCPMSPFQGIFTSYVLGRLFGQPAISSSFVRGSLVLVEPRTDEDEYIGQVLEEGETILVKRLHDAMTEDVDVDNVLNIFQPGMRHMVMRAVQAGYVLDSLVGWGPETELIFRDDSCAWYGLQTLLCNDALQGGLWWITVTRQLLEMESRLGNRSLHELLEPIHFEVKNTGKSSLSKVLGGIDAAVDCMTKETCEGFFKVLLGSRHCIDDLLTILRACEATPVSKAADASSQRRETEPTQDSKALPWKLLGSLAFRAYQEQMIESMGENTSPSRLKETFDLFQAAGALKIDLLETWERLFTVLVDQATWLPEKGENSKVVEEVAKSYGELLTETDEIVLPMLKQIFKRLLKTCISKERREVYLPILMEFLSAFLHLLDEAEVDELMSHYIVCRRGALSERKASFRDFKIGREAKNILCILCAGGELSILPMVPEDAVSAAVKRACQESEANLLVLLQPLQFLGCGLPVTEISKEMCDLLVEMIAGQAMGIGDDIDIFLASVHLMVDALNNTSARYLQTVDEALVALLAGRSPADVLCLTKKSGKPWRLLLKAWDRLKQNCLGAKEVLEKLFEATRELLAELLKGEITLELAEVLLVEEEDLLDLLKTMAKHLVNDEKTYGFPPLSEIGESTWSHRVSKRLMNAVFEYDSAAGGARAFLTLCEQCGLADGRKVLKAGHAVLEDDRQQALKSLPHKQDRWWFCSKIREASSQIRIKDLANSAIFRCIVSEWAKAQGLSDVLDDAEEDEDLEVKESHEDYLSTCSRNSASWWLCETLQTQIQLFQSLCHLLAQTPVNKLSFQTVKSIISMEQDTEEQLHSAAKASGVEFPKEPVDTVWMIRTAARIHTVAGDLNAVLVAAKICGFDSAFRGPADDRVATKISKMANKASECAVLPKTDVMEHFQKEPKRQLGVEEVEKAVQEADAVLSELRVKNCIPIVRALVDAKDLYDFLKDLLKEDFSPLQDSIETYSDELLRADTFFALMDAQRFFRALLRHRNSNSKRSLSFYRALLECMKDLSDCGNLAKKLSSCTQHCRGLKNLYKNLSNREEVATEKIRAAMEAGTFEVLCNTNGLQISLSYSRRTISGRELRDLRDRAMMNSSEDTTRASRADLETMMRFCEQVDMLRKACETLETLREEGFYWAKEAKYEASNASADALDELKQLEEGFQADLKKWRLQLQEARAKYPALSFVFSKQFWLLGDFLQGLPMEHLDVQMVLCMLSQMQGQALSQTQQNEALHFVGQYGVPYQSCYAERPLPDRSQLQKWFEVLCERLEALNEKCNLWQEHLGGTSMSLPEMEMGLNSVVEAGKVRSVRVESKAGVLRTALGFYGGARCLPRAHEMLFCGDTQWPQLDAFLSRCRYVPGLYCMLHVNRLSYRMQHRIVERIKSGQLGPNFRLVLIAECKSEDLSNVHTLTEIPPTPAHALSDESLHRFVEHLAPELVCVVSDDAGCGKTETVRQRANTLRKDAVTVPLSGPINMGNFIERLLVQKWRACDCIHLDIGPTQQLDLLDDILVQMSFFGILQAESKIAVVPRDYVFVELANLSTRDLSNLTICSLVQPRRVHFDINEFHVCHRSRSPIQVVCRVLEAFENQSLSETRVKLDGESIREERCRELLRHHIVQKIRGPTSYALLHTVLRVLAVQFISFCNSAYFDPKSLNAMNSPTSLRPQLVESLLEACIDFTTRAVTASKMRQRDQYERGSAEAAVSLDEGMMRWSDTKPMLTFNLFDLQTVSLVFREECQVSKEVKELFLSQATGGVKELPNYEKMTTKELEDRLGCIILRHGKKLGKPAVGSSYVVSPDNFIKMVWIALRVESRVPVIIMGETGCGKTSLIRHLARLLSVDFTCLNVHAGTSAENIIEFVEGAAARSGTTWAFMDEVNTCEHMGLMTEILCHQRLLGKPLPQNLVLLAACNPYRLKKKLTDEAERAQAQLVLRDSSKQRKHSDRVYSVQELPESMYDYLYDFGSLGKKEEESYVEAMVQSVFAENDEPDRRLWQLCLKDLILFSQSFTAEHQPACLLSLRDVKRCVTLVDWFQAKTLLREKATEKTGQDKESKIILSVEDRTLRSVLNALAVSYHCRLPTHTLRNKYRAQIAEILFGHGKLEKTKKKTQTEGDHIHELFKEEMKLYIAHMTLPEMTAINNALLENVFVMMVCILNRIPVFVVGKPGNSKSLALRILSTNLRGQDSEKELWREFPRLSVISYQGSEVSTSEGIAKVFERAKICQNSIDSDEMVLVHFDEIGLAEASPNNPLKVLHAHLEPGYPKDRPDFAVVGLSNFPLDAAKMNRGITLVRPPPNKDDLVKTAKEIGRGKPIAEEEGLMKSLATLYCAYYQELRVQDFHGLRDFYALVKTLAKTFEASESDFERGKVLHRALARNFGGLLPTRSKNHGETSDCDIWQMQKRKRSFDLRIKTNDAEMSVSLVDMLEENLADPDARHLMLLCSEVNVALTLLKRAAEKAGPEDRKLSIMMGSSFPEDQTDQHSFGQLKRVVLSMERGDILVMRGMDSIHASLYDMLNMSYTTFGNKRNCRIALGDKDLFVPVHDDFRCVVLQDAAELSTADAAFLNRFEKHYVSINDMVTTPAHWSAVEKLTSWVAEATHQGRWSGSPGPNSLLVGWGAETAASLINHIVQRSGREYRDPNRLATDAWKELTALASVDGMLRATELSAWSRWKEQAQEWRRNFFQKPQSLQQWLLSWQNPRRETGETAARFAVVLTTSLIQVDLDKVLRASHVPAFKRLAVDALTSELDLRNKLEDFNDDELPTGAVLVLQLRADSPHVELVQHLCADLRPNRRALVFLHGSRRLLMSTGGKMRFRLSFQIGWTQVFLERLVEEWSLNVQKCVELPLDQLLQADGPMPFNSVLKSVLCECFWYIKYPAIQAAAEHVEEVTKVVLNDEGLLDIFQKICLEEIQKATKKVWWHKVILDMQRMTGHASFSECLEAHVRQLVRAPAAVLVYLLEKACALFTLSLYPEACPMREAWFHLCQKVVLPQMKEVPQPTGPEQYQYPQQLQHLRVPFCAFFAEKLDSFRTLYFERKLYKVPHHDPRLQDLRGAMEAAIGEGWFQFLKEHQDDYAHDLGALRLTAVPLPQEEQRRFLQPVLQDRVRKEGILELHRFLWQHQGTLQLALRLLAAIPSRLRQLDRLLSTQALPTEADQLQPENMARMMFTISAHACGALHPTAATLAAVDVDWLPAAKRVLSATRSCLDLRGREHLAVVEFSALSIMSEVSQKMERMNLPDFWKQLELCEAIRQPEELCGLVQKVLKAAEPHMTQSALQHFQHFAHQRLLEHGVSAGVLQSVTSGPPAVATAMLLRELVQSGVQQDPECFLRHLQTGSALANPLQALDQLAREANVGDPLCAVMCVELQDFGFPTIDVTSASTSFPSDTVARAATLLKSLFQETRAFCFAHVAAAAVLRLAAQRAAEALTKDRTLLDKELEDALSEACHHEGSNGARFLASLLRSTVLREVHCRMDDVNDISGLVELCRAVPWLEASLPVPGDAPLLKGTAVPIFLGGFMPEAVEAAQAIMAATESPKFLELARKASMGGLWRFAWFSASSAFLCNSRNETAQDRAREQARQVAQTWLNTQPQLQQLPPLVRAQSEALPREMRRQLEVEPMQMLTALHLAAALLAAPRSGFSAPFKAIAEGNFFQGFLPGMDDQQEVIFRALHEGNREFTMAYSGHTRYTCQCGEIYMVADCGQAVQLGRCPSCSREIGGLDYAERQNQRLDEKPRHGESQQGYLEHLPSTDRRHAVRQLTPLPSRVLHFFLHAAMLGPCFQHHVPQLNYLTSILKHLTADWEVLTELLGGSPAGVLMDVAGKLLYHPADPAAKIQLHSERERSEWERRLSEAVVMPCLDPTRRADFNARLDWSSLGSMKDVSSLGSMKDTLPQLLADRLPPTGIATCRTEDTDSEPRSTALQDLLTTNGRFLELGCGDLSFARSWLLERRRRGAATAGDFDLTSSMFEHWDVVRTRYSAMAEPYRATAEENRLELENYRCTVLDCVDGTKLDQLTEKFELPRKGLFQAVIFNFPYGGTFVDSICDMHLAEHTNLLDGVFQSAVPLLTQGGCIWVSLLSSQFHEWRVEDLARRRGFVLVKSEPFPWSSFPDYRPVWGDDRDFERTQPRQSYTGHRNFAVSYCFTRSAAQLDLGSAASNSAMPVPVPTADLVKLGCSRMLRLVEKPSMSRLERDFHGATAPGGPAVRHPLLRAFLEAGQELQLVRHLADILEWQRFVKRHFEYELSREDARQLQVQEALRHRLQRPEDVTHGERLFDRFQAAWAECASKGCMVRYGCSVLPDPPEMNLDAALCHSCPDEDNIHIVALMQSLVYQHNAFLKKVQEIAQGDLPAAWAVRSILGRGSLPQVSVEEVNETHLLIPNTQERGMEWMTSVGSAGALAAWEVATAGRHQTTPELLVPGTQCVFDWDLLEQEVAERVLEKAVLIDFKVVPFSFSGEAFLHQYGFLEEVCMRVEQEVSPEQPRNFLMSNVRAVDLLAPLQAALALVRRLAPPPELPVKDLCHRWLNASHLHSLMQQSECHGLEVRHLVHLVEAVELQAAEEILQSDALAQIYCEGLTDGALPCMQTWKRSTAVRVQEIMLRIFVRWLSHGQPKANDLVSDYAERALRQVPRDNQVEGLVELFGDLKFANFRDALHIARENC